MQHYAIYAIDDSIEPVELVADDADADDDEADTETETDDEDADYTPRTVATPKRRRRIGEVTLDESGVLAVVSAEPADAAELKTAVDHMNERPKLFIKLPPKPGAPRFSLVKVPVTRGEPRFFEALQDNLQRWHGMELEAEAG